MRRGLGSTGRRVNPTRSSLVVMLTSATVLTSCSVADSPRWARPDNGIVTPAPGFDADSGVVAVVERGPIVDITTFRASVGFARTETVHADRVGRIERRLARVGERVQAGDVIMELSAARDPADDLRVEILERQRELAELEGRLDDVDRFDEEIAAERATSLPGGAGAIVADRDGVLNRYLADVFSTVRVGAPVYELGAGDDFVATFSANGTTITDLAVGDDVVIREIGPLAPSVSGTVLSIGQPDGNGTIAIDVSLPNDLEVAVGGELDIDLETATEATGTRVETAAVRRGPDGTFLVVVDESGTWTATPVEIGESTDDFSQLLSSNVPVGAQVIVP